MDVIIIGAGIGGLTLGLMLHRAGIPCRIYESTQELKAVGVGISVLPHASRELVGLGLEEALANVAVTTREFCFYNRYGQFIYSEPAGRYAGYEYPMFSIHRGDLQMILLAAAQQALGAEQIRVGHKLASFTQDERGVDAIFTDRAGNERGRFHADIMIASDGIHSVVRSHYYPDEGMPLWNGTIMWRGTTVGKPFLTGGSVVKAGWTSQKFIVYPISRQHADRGEALINWIADLHFDNTNLMEREDWNRPGKIEDFLPAFESWKFPWMDVPEVIRNAQSIFEFPMVDRDPVAQWSFGRVVLLGDAAHPMLQYLAQGANMAMEDGFVLGRCLDAHRDDLPRGLRAYEDARRERTAQVCDFLRRDFGLTVMPHLTCVGHSRAELGRIADRIHGGGFRNIMTLRGDPPKGQTEFVPYQDGLRYANDLVALLKARHPDFCLGVGGYPETHPEAPSAEADLQNLKRKVDAGAAFVTTQLFFENQVYYRFVDRCRKAGITVPIVPGIMPALSLKQIQRITGMCGTALPADLARRLESAGDNTEAMEAAGLDWAITQIRDLLGHGIPGYHLYILNRAKGALALAAGLAT